MRRAAIASATSTPTSTACSITACRNAASLAPQRYFIWYEAWVWIQRNTTTSASSISRPKTRPRPRPSCPNSALNPALCVALAPGESGRHPYKSWSAAGFVTVAAALRAEWNAKILVVGSARDRLLGEEILAGFDARALNLAGRTTPSELAGVLARCDLLIGLDSGPLHLAAAMGRPVVGLFGPTDPARTGPQGPGHQIICHRESCWPCMTPTCQDRACMTRITPEEGAGRRPAGPRRVDSHPTS